MQASSASKHVGIWIRVSSEDQVRGESPETHERRARLYAEAKGWNVVTVYRLDAISGKTVNEHPEAKRMLVDIREGNISGLVFSKLARLARNTKELLDFADIFRECGADLISLAESIDTSTPAGRLFFTIIAAMATWEREEIQQRVAASVPIRAQMGKPLGGQASLGYEWKDKKLVVNQAEAPVRKLVYELYREHKRKKTVARILNDRGFRMRSGSPFTDSTIGRLIQDPTAKGLRRANYTRLVTDKNGKPAVERKPESDWVFHDVEAIVPEELWTECNTILLQQRQEGKRKGRRPVHLFTGFVYCQCGQKMYVPSTTPKYLCYTCRTKIPIEDLEQVYHSEIKDFLFSPEKIADHLEQADETIKQRAGQLEHLERERKKVQAEIDKLYDLYQSDQIDKHGFGAKYRPLAVRLVQLDDQIPAAQAELDVLKITELGREEILASARDIHTAWPTLSQDEKRQIVEAITERITVSKDEILIELFASPTPGGTPPTGNGGPAKPSPSSPQNGSSLATKPPSCVAFLPGVHVRLNPPRLAAVPAPPQTLGDHIRQRREVLGLGQREAAPILGVDRSTLGRWELGAFEPEAPYFPRILGFLGYDPCPQPTTYADRLLAKRRKEGWTVPQAATHLGTDYGTWSRWEYGKTCPRGRWRILVERLLNE